MGNGIANPGFLRRMMARWKPASSSARPDDYETKIATERDIYANCVNVHELPPIFQYWVEKHLRPKLETLGFSSPDDLFIGQLARQCARDPNQQNEFISIGSGNCNTEVSLAVALRQQGFTNFTLECLDLNGAMLERGKQIAIEKGVSENLSFAECDFNRWQPAKQYDAVLANQSLHHVLNLEGLFSAVKHSLKPDALFLTADMIGCNGHMRWPEALAIVHEFWQELPISYRYNQQLQRQEDLYENWDCSGEGFEGVRAQDVLPLLVKNFHFELFVAFGNVIFPFIDRGFGHNFNPNGEWDRDFIDRVHQRDELEMKAGRIKPTQMMAVLRNEPVSRMKFHPPLTPEFSIRPT